MFVISDIGILILSTVFFAKIKYKVCFLYVSVMKQQLYSYLKKVIRWIELQLSLRYPHFKSFHIRLSVFLELPSTFHVNKYFAFVYENLKWLFANDERVNFISRPSTSFPVIQCVVIHKSLLFKIQMILSDICCGWRFFERFAVDVFVPVVVIHKSFSSNISLMKWNSNN